MNLCEIVLSFVSVFFLALLCVLSVLICFVLCFCECVLIVCIFALCVLCFCCFCFSSRFGLDCFVSFESCVFQIAGILETCANFAQIPRQYILIYNSRFRCNYRL